MSNLLQVPPNQLAFNETCAKQLYSAQSQIKRMYIDPDDLLKSGCQPELIGLGRYHHFSPSRHLGLPLPPCPRCGY